MTLIDVAMNRARQEAEAAGIDVLDLRTADGRWVMNDLIKAKGEALHSSIMLDLLEYENE